MRRVAAAGPIFLLAVSCGSAIAKERSWLGPVNLIQGDPPTQRDSFAFTSSGGKLFVYAGIGDVIGNYVSDCTL
jgi:hypothetical protein